MTHDMPPAASIAPDFTVRCRGMAVSSRVLRRAAARFGGFVAT
jgi:hypothetical protein